MRLALLFVPLVLAACGGAPGARASGHPCAPGACSSLTPDGLEFWPEGSLGGITTLPTVAVGGAMRISFAPSGEPWPGYPYEPVATPRETFTATAYATPTGQARVELLALGEGVGNLAIFDPRTGRLYDEVPIDAKRAAHVGIEPWPPVDTWAVEPGAQLLVSPTARAADGTSLTDSLATVAAAGGTIGHPPAESLLSHAFVLAVAADARSLTLDVTFGDAETTFDVGVVTVVDTIDVKLDDVSVASGASVHSGAVSRVCVSGRSGTSTVFLATPRLSASVALDVSPVDPASSLLFYDYSCVDVGFPRGTYTLTVAAGGRSFSFEVTST